MALTSKTIITVKDLLSQSNFKIPDYQRPYKWNSKNVNQLIDDIILHKDKSAYRIGTLVLHEDGEKVYIVDGQQRTITLILIALGLFTQHENYAGNIIKGINSNLLNLSFSNEISLQNIQQNYLEIKRRMNDFDKKSILFFFLKCELVQITLSDISEAFQFFDSQNSRGKDLEPHDLLKAFHLREMAKIPEEEKLEAVSAWESMDTKELSDLFSIYLFRIRNWSKGRSARFFTKNEVDIFKGISPDIKEDYPYIQLFRIAHYFTENYNLNYQRMIDFNKLQFPFQIDQPVINGKRFFELVSHYKTKIDELQKDRLHFLIENKYFTNREDQQKYSLAKDILQTINTYDGCGRVGDKYIKNLFYCTVIYYWDRFGRKDIEKAIEKLFIWAYSLRLEKYAVQIASVDNHVIYGNNVFKKIREAITPSEIINMKLNNLYGNNSTKTEDIVELFKKMNYYNDK